MQVNPNNSTNEIMSSHSTQGVGNQRSQGSVMSRQKFNAKAYAQTAHKLIENHDIEKIKILINSLTSDNYLAFMEEYIKQNGRNIILDLNNLTKYEAGTTILGYTIKAEKPAIPQKDIDQVFAKIKSIAPANSLITNMINSTELLHTLNTNDLAKVKNDLNTKITNSNALFIYDNYQAVATEIGEYAGTDKEIKATKTGFYKSAQERPMRCESLFQGIMKCPAFSKANKEEQKKCIEDIINKIAENARNNDKIPKGNIQKFVDFAKKDLLSNLDNYYDGKARHRTAYDTEKKFIELIGEPLWGRGYIKL